MGDNHPPRMILAMASETDDRETWNQVETIQAEMFAAGPAAIKLCYFGREGASGIRPYVSTRWVTDADDMADLIEHARRNCICGCFLQVADVLEPALREAQQAPLTSVVIITDDFHGDFDTMVATAKQLRDAGTQLFLFQVGATGGALRDFAEATDSVLVEINPYVEKVAKRLPAMLEAVTHFTISGKAGLKALDNEAANRLLEQMDASNRITAR